ncbi:MAG: tRNA (N6-isopentenyl adenosine(37)-C2)-methylthiotransferase MiaB [bacterium]
MLGTYEIITFGCQMNKADSEVLAGLLEEAGYRLHTGNGFADVVLLNTCAVRDHAENKAYSYLGEYLALKEDNPAMVVGFAGCVAQKEGAKLLERFSQLDLVLGPRNLTALAGYIRSIREDGKRIVAVDGEVDMADHSTPRQRSKTGQGWLTVMTGCDKFCSYCIVPYTRGREKSRPPGDILAELKKLIEQGYREITLLGQSVNSYGKDLDEEITFCDLLARANDLPGDFRLRFTSPHPMDTTDELIEAYRRLPRLAANIHLPVQSGSNRILKAMNRKYTREDYLEIIKKIRDLERYVSITTDVIVGYPGETEEDFQQTLDLFEEVRFSKAYIYRYSPRSGTRASRLVDTVPEPVVANRHAKLLDCYKKQARIENQRLCGRTLQVFVEGSSPKSEPGNRQFTGRTSTNHVIVFDSLPEYCIGSFVPVKVDKAESYTLFGSVDPVFLAKNQPVRA